MKKSHIVAFLVLALAALALFSYIPSMEESEKLVIFHAGSLSVPIAEVSNEFRNMRNVEIQAESSGSVEAVRKVTELGKEADLIALADYGLIPKMLIPEYADFYVIFATNEIVIAYSNQSKYANEISPDNWFEVLSKNDVTFGFSDPNKDPCGYRSLIALKLASIYYGKPIFEELVERNTNVYAEGNEIIVPKEVQTNEKVTVRAKEVDLTALVETGALDYFFIYKSVAMQHGLRFVELPKEVNLGDYSKKDYYSQISVLLGYNNEKILAEPIAYGATILKNAPNKKIALEYLKFMLSERGREIFEKNYQHFLFPALAYGEVPDELRGVVKEVQ